MRTAKNKNIYEYYIYICAACLVYLFAQYFGVIKIPILTQMVPLEFGNWLDPTLDSRVRTASEAARVCMLVNLIGFIVLIRSIFIRKTGKRRDSGNLIIVSLVMSLLSAWLSYYFFSLVLSDDVRISQMSPRSFLLDFVLSPLSAPVMLWLGLVVAYDAIRGKFG